MPYTRAWDPANMLLGARDADEIDDAVRDFARDLDERFASILVDPDADPWQLKADPTKYVLHWSEAHIQLRGSTTAWPTQTAQRAIPPGSGPTPAGFFAYFPITAPKGSNLTELSIKCLRTASSALINTTFGKIDAAGTVTTIDTLNAAVDANVQDLAYTGVNETLGDGECWLLIVEVAADPATPSTAGLYSIAYTLAPVWSD